MKKLVLMFVAIAAISFASCGNKTEQSNAADSDTVAVDSAVDSASVDTANVDSVLRLFLFIYTKHIQNYIRTLQVDFEPKNE